MTKKKKATPATDKLLKWPKFDVNEPPTSRKANPPHKTKSK